jgi:hypothetical protein
VAEGYIENSIENKMKTAKKILVGENNSRPSCPASNDEKPSTSNEANIMVNKPSASISSSVEETKCCGYKKFSCRDPQ